MKCYTLIFENMRKNFQGKTLLITGGAGFIGSNLIHHLLQKTAYSIINLDALTYAGNLENLGEIPERFASRYRFEHGNINNFSLVCELIRHADAILHLAAESHVDRSILNAQAFVETNIQGTLTLLNAVLEKNPSIRFIHVSTDEVYGSLSDVGFFTENSPLEPNSPYAASKASSDLLVRSFVHTHQLDAIITRCSNNYGPYQFPEKLIPLMIENALHDQPLPVYGKGQNTRDWIHVRDHCAGLVQALEYGRSGEVYLFGGRAERKNIDVIQAILKQLDKPTSLIQYVQDRKGHDWRYAIDCTKAEQELSWGRSVNFTEGLAQTIDWYLGNQNWLKNIQKKRKTQ